MVRCSNNSKLKIQEWLIAGISFNMLNTCTLHVDTINTIYDMKPYNIKNIQRGIMKICENVLIMR